MPETLPLRPEAESPAAPSAAIEPLLVPVAEAARSCSRSEASWWRDHAAERIPAPVKLGGRTLWRVEELREWVAAGCPDRKTWQAMQAAKNTAGHSRKGGR